MNISLTPELEKYVYEKIKNGLYTSASEVVRESLRLMHTYEAMQQQRIAQLNREIEIGLRDIELGRTVSRDESYNRFKTKIKNATKGGK